MHESWAAKRALPANMSVSEIRGHLGDMLALETLLSA
jgi:hypothetical protein